MKEQLFICFFTVGCFIFLCRDLQLEEYVDLYWRDYPSLISGFTETCLIDQGKSYLIACNDIMSGNEQDTLL